MVGDESMFVIYQFAYKFVFVISGQVTFIVCRTVGVRLGAGESLHDILSSSRQVAEGVSTAGQTFSAHLQFACFLLVAGLPVLQD